MPVCVCVPFGSKRTGKHVVTKGAVGMLYQAQTQHARMTTEYVQHATHKPTHPLTHYLTHVVEQLRRAARLCTSLMCI